MCRLSVISCILAAALLIAPATRSMAQGSDILLDALGGVLKNARTYEAARIPPYEAARTQQRQRYEAARIPQRQLNTSRGASTSSTREESRLIQMALNHFGFPAGTADGILGKRSRAAIAQYQNSNGYAATGVLTDSQKVRLIESYRRSTAGESAAIPVPGAELPSVVGAQLLIDIMRNRTTARTRPGRVFSPTTNKAIVPGGSAVVAPRTRRRDTTTPTLEGELRVFQQPGEIEAGAPLTRRIAPGGSAVVAPSTRQQRTTTPTPEGELRVFQQPSETEAGAPLTRRIVPGRSAVVAPDTRRQRTTTPIVVTPTESDGTSTDRIQERASRKRLR